MLENNSLSHKFQGTVTESEVRKIHCSVVTEVLDNEIKPHNGGTYLFLHCNMYINHGQISFPCNYYFDLRDFPKK